MRPRTRIALIVGGAVLVIVLLRIAGVFQPVEAVSRVALLPVARAFAATGTGIRNTIFGSADLTALRESNTELEARLASIAVDYVHLRALEEENRSLQALTKFTTRTGYDYVSARVIARSVDPLSATVLIDRGSKDGLETGMAVIVGDGIFVGKITTLNERVATVTLVSDEHSRVAAALSGQERLFGMVEGSGNNVARLTLVPQLEALKRDDVIVTAGTEEKIPSNLTIGLVNEVEGRPTDPFKSAVLEPFAKSEHLDLVIVLRPAALRPEGSSGL